MEETNDVPDVPEVDVEDMDVPGYVKERYDRMLKNRRSQQATMRRIIYRKKETSKEEVGEILEEHGYSSSGGSVKVTLKILDEVTDEIDSKWGEKITWTGED